MEFLLDALLDTLKAIPLLYLVYLLVGYFSHKNKEKQVAKNSKKYGPLIGGAFGIIPQCGFAAVMADLFARRSITIGTLFAVFIATSDEAFAILILYPEHYLDLGLLLGIKLVAAIVMGYIIDLIFHKKSKSLKDYNGHEICDCGANHKHNGNNHEAHSKKTIVLKKNLDKSNRNGKNAIVGKKNIEKHLQNTNEKAEVEKLEICTECHCCATNIFYDALLHTLKIAILLFVVGAILGGLVEWIGEENISKIFGSSIILSIFLAALVGLFPTCAVSVILVTFFVSGIIAFPAMVAGLCASAGLGLVVLFARNHNLKQNILITVTLYVIAVIIGLITWGISLIF